MRASFLLPVIFSSFHLGAQGLYWVGSDQPAKEDRFLQKRFARYDVSGDSSLNMREFASSRGNARFKEISRANLLAFLKADVIADGLLNEREYIVAHRQGKVLFPGERALIFGKADKNRDGQLDEREWKNFAKRAAEAASLAFYDDDQNGSVTWMEWLGHAPSADHFIGARLKYLKRVLPESLSALLAREASLHSDLILGARDNLWTREVVQQLALFAPARLLKDGIDYLPPVGASFGYAVSPPDDFKLPWTASLSVTYSPGRSIVITSPSANNVYTGSTYVQSGSLSVAGNSVTTSSSSQTQLPLSPIFSPLETSSVGLGSSLILESSAEERSQITQINAPMDSFIDVSVTVTVFRCDNSPTAKFPIGISNVFPLTPPDPRGISHSGK